jgi:hypothetical protein
MAKFTRYANQEIFEILGKQIKANLKEYLQNLDIYEDTYYFFDNKPCFSEVIPLNSMFNLYAHMNHKNNDGLTLWINISFEW